MYVYVHLLENDKNIEHTTAKEEKTQSKEATSLVFRPSFHAMFFNDKEKKERSEAEESKKGPKKRPGLQPRNWFQALSTKSKKAMDLRLKCLRWFDSYRAVK
jgi:hypothetical protein